MGPPRSERSCSEETAGFCRSPLHISLHFIMLPSGQHFPDYSREACEKTFGYSVNFIICIQKNGRICFNQLSAFINYFKAYAQVSKLSLHTVYITQNAAYIQAFYSVLSLISGEKTNYF